MEKYLKLLYVVFSDRWNSDEELSEYWEDYKEFEKLPSFKEFKEILDKNGNLEEYLYDTLICTYKYGKEDSPKAIWVQTDRGVLSAEIEDYSSTIEIHYMKNNGEKIDANTFEELRKDYGLLHPTLVSISEYANDLEVKICKDVNYDDEEPQKIKIDGLAEFLGPKSDVFINEDGVVERGHIYSVESYSKEDEEFGEGMLFVVPEQEKFTVPFDGQKKFSCKTWCFKALWHNCANVAFMKCKQLSLAQKASLLKIYGKLYYYADGSEVPSVDPEYDEYDVVEEEFEAIVKMLNAEDGPYIPVVVSAVRFTEDDVEQIASIINEE